MVLTIAGSDTTAATLLAIIYHVLSDESIFTRLRKELETAMPDPGEPPVPSELDRLPFLNALIEETLRMYPTVVSRQDRVAPSQDLVYQHEDGREKNGAAVFVLIHEILAWGNAILPTDNRRVHS